MENLETQTVNQDDNVSENLDALGLTVEGLSELVGRPVKDLEDFKKHYNNLKSFVGKKGEPEIVNEDLKKSQEELQAVKNWLNDAGIDTSKLNPFQVKTYVEGINQPDIAPRTVASNNEQIRKIENLGLRAMAGDSDAKQGLVAEVLGLNNFAFDKTQNETLSRIQK